MAEGNFVTAINCMDGRAQIPVIEYMRDNFNLEHIDMITEPGPNKILSDAKQESVIDSLRKKVEISVKKHGSEVIAVVGHYDCVGNTADEDGQKEDLLKAVKVITSWGFPVKKIIALWLDEDFKPRVVS